MHYATVGAKAQAQRERAASNAEETEAPCSPMAHDSQEAGGDDSAAGTLTTASTATAGWRSVLCQSRTAAALMCQTLAQGMAQGWSSPGVSKLRKGEGPFKPDETELAWIVSLFELGLLVGSLVSAGVFTRLGRRHTLFVGPLAFLAWTLLTYFAASASWLYAARLLAGTGMGVNFTFSSVYLGEVATPLMRGVLILVMTLLAPTGQLLSFLIGPKLDYWQEALSPLPLIVASVLLHLLWTSETPFYLTMKGRDAEAEQALFGLRHGHEPEHVRQELANMRRSVHRQLEEAKSWRQTLSPPGVKRATLIVMVLSGSPALFGVTTVLSFTQRIFEEADAPLPVESSILTIGVKVVMIVLSMYLAERLGRRVQLSATAFINFAAMLAMSAYFLCKERLHLDVHPAGWVPLVSLLTFMAATGAGVIPVSHILQGELLSQRAKMVVAPLAAVLLAATSFAIQRCFPLVGDTVGYFVMFGLYAVTNLVIALFTVFVVPETRGRTLMQVQDELRERALSGVPWWASSPTASSSRKRLLRGGDDRDAAAGRAHDNAALDA